MQNTTPLVPPVAPDDKTRFPFKAFRTEGCCSYLLADPITREALVIDPHVSLIDDYQSAIAEMGLKPRYAIDTRLHTDHISATDWVKSAYSAQIAMGSATSSQRVDIRLKDDDRLYLGGAQGVSIEALETPGVAVDAVCLVVRFGGYELIFSGDTLKMGATGYAADANVANLYSSLQKLVQLSPAAVVLPGHDERDILFSTLARERDYNPHLSCVVARNRDAFLAAKSIEAKPPSAKDAAEIENLNLAPSASSAWRSSPIRGEHLVRRARPGQLSPSQSDAAGDENDDGPMLRIGIEKFAEKLRHRQRGKTRVPGTQTLEALIDVRERWEFAEGHMPTARNIPLSELIFESSDLIKAGRIYFSCLSGRRSAMATQTWMHLRHPESITVEGGFRAYASLGYPVEK